MQTNQRFNQSPAQSRRQGRVVGASFDSDAVAIFNFARTQGYALPTGQQALKQSDLIAQLKTAGIWNKLDVFWMYLTNGDSNYATINWKNPAANQVTKVNSPIFTTNRGFKGNALDAYLNTNFSGATGPNYTQDNASRFAWIMTAQTTNASIDSTASGTINRLFNSSVATQRINQGSASLNAAADLSGTGLRVINRTSSTNVELFSNLTQISRTATSSIVSSQTQVILASPSSPAYGDMEVACYGMGASLVAENTLLYNALNNYISNPS